MLHEGSRNQGVIGEVVGGSPQMPTPTWLERGQDGLLLIHTTWIGADTARVTRISRLSRPPSCNMQVRLSGNVCYCLQQAFRVWRRPDGLVSPSTVRGHLNVNRSDTVPTRFANVSCAHVAARRRVLGERQLMADLRRSGVAEQTAGRWPRPPWCYCSSAFLI